MPHKNITLALRSLKESNNTSKEAFIDFLKSKDYIRYNPSYKNNFWINLNTLIPKSERNCYIEDLYTIKVDVDTNSFWITSGYSLVRELDFDKQLNTLFTTEAQEGLKKLFSLANTCDIYSYELFQRYNLKIYKTNANYFTTRFVSLDGDQSNWHFEINLNSNEKLERSRVVSNYSFHPKNNNYRSFPLDTNLFDQIVKDLKEVLTLTEPKIKSDLTDINNWLENFNPEEVDKYIKIPVNSNEPLPSLGFKDIQRDFDWLTNELLETCKEELLNNNLVEALIKVITKEDAPYQLLVNRLFLYNYFRKELSIDFCKYLEDYEKKLKENNMIDYLYYISSWIWNTDCFIPKDLAKNYTPVIDSNLSPIFIFEDGVDFSEVNLGRLIERNCTVILPPTISGRLSFNDLFKLKGSHMKMKLNIILTTKENETSYEVEKAIYDAFKEHIKVIKV